MAITTISGFDVQAKSPIDKRLVLSKTEMLNINDKLMPDNYFAICTTDNQFYIYDKYIEPNSETGKFRLITRELATKVSSLEGDVAELKEDVEDLDERVDDISTMTDEEIYDIIDE